MQSERSLNALLEGDFEPKMLPTVRGLYSVEARVLPNIDGIFPITLLNVTTSDIHLKSGKMMGSIQLTNESVTRVPEGNGISMDASDISFGSKLSDTQKNELWAMIINYQDVFATNPKSPKRTELLEHHIITDGALPVYKKAHRIPVAWENEVDKQVSEMLSNDIIRPSYSPWNAPVILVKKKDDSTRFVCNFR